MTLYTNFTDGLTGQRRRMLVEDGRVVWNTTDAGADAPTAEVINLRGRVLSPKFVDAHCHILPMGLDLQKLHLGDCQTKADVLDSVRHRHNDHPDGWLMAVHYDQTKFADGEHLTRLELDAISTTRPILLRHVNGHASVANTGALMAAQVTRATPDPSGGTFVRDASGELTGVLLEHAHERVTAAAPSPTVEQMVHAILAAGDKMAKFNIGTATDMMTGRYDLPKELEAYRLAAERGNPIRVRLCLQWGSVFLRQEDRSRKMRDDLAELTAGFNPETLKVWGVKIFADGAIGSATAAIYGRFTGSSPEGDSDGQLMYSADRFKEMVRMADDAGFCIATHTIGDRSTDLVMDAYEQTQNPRRHRIEHAMMLSDAQIERMAKLGSHVTMQPEFLHRFGHAYQRQLGSERAAKLKRFRSVLDAGIELSFNSDSPIVLGDPIIGIETACNRPTGFDPGENTTREEATRAYTEMGARANHDHGLMGTLAENELADFFIAEE
ncbi:MAG: amidohydrolase [Fimbriimonadaceae bacterium]